MRESRLSLFVQILSVKNFSTTKHNLDKSYIILYFIASHTVSCPVHGGRGSTLKIETYIGIPRRSRIRILNRKSPKLKLIKYLCFELATFYWTPS